MLKYLLLLLLLLTVPAFVSATPIKNLDDFQKSIDRCITGESPDACLNKLLLPHFVPGNPELEKTLPGVTGLLTRWLDGDKVFAIHPIKTTKVGDLVERRISVIESDQGGMMVVEATYVRLHGELYLLNYNLSSTKETIDKLFKGEL